KDTLQLLLRALDLAPADRTALVAASRRPPKAPGDVSPARTRASRPTALPVQPTPFIGREQAISAVVDLLAHGVRRLVTITGPGGVGKTRLAVHVADTLREAFPDGVWFVDLSPLTDPALVPVTILASLG